MTLRIAVVFLGFLLALPARANVGLSTVPERDLVRLTIYNGVDLTLVQEFRTLVLKKGLNRIQYQWANTLIDSTSLELRPLAKVSEIDVADVVYPKGAPATLVWEVQSQVEGPVRFEISGFTSGLAWTADYSLRANADESSADVEGFVSIVNGSGEDYAGAEVRLVVGTVHLVETVRDLATQQVYLRKQRLSREEVRSKRDVFLDSADDERAGAPMATISDAAMKSLAAPVVESRRFGDYHLFTIEGTHALATGATTRLRAISTSEPMPLEVLLRTSVGANGAQLLYRFVNDDAHHLPKGPLPEGAWDVYRVVDAKTGQLSYVGRSSHAYVPPDQKVELALGVDPAIAVKSTSVSYRESGHVFGHEHRLRGWFTHQTHRFKLVNTRAIPVSVEFIVPTGGGEWKITGLDGERRDQQTFRVQARVEAGRTWETGDFTITTRVGDVGARELPDPPNVPGFPAISLRP